MTTVNGSISISCLNCEKVFLMVDQLTKSMQEFEIFTMEIQLDPKSVKFKSQEVLANFWHLISTIKTFINVSREQKLKALAFSQNPNPKPDPNPIPTQSQNENKIQNQSSSNQNLDLSTVKREVKSEPEESESESEPESDYEYKPSKSKPKSKSRPKFKSRTVRTQKIKVRPIPNTTAQRLNELQASHKYIRTIECDMDEGFYNLHECTKCGRQFNDKYSGVRHVQLVHLRLGLPCPTCNQKYFSKKSLEIHVAKCTRGRGRQFKLRKVPINNESNKLVQVHLYPHHHQKQQQQQQHHQRQKQSHSTLSQNRNKNKNRHRHRDSDKKDQECGKEKKPFDPMKVIVRNPCPYFSLKTALDVKVAVERLDMDKVTTKIEPAPRSPIPTLNSENGENKLEDAVVQSGTETETGEDIIKIE